MSERIRLKLVHLLRYTVYEIRLEFYDDILIHVELKLPFDVYIEYWNTEEEKVVLRNFEVLPISLESTDPDEVNMFFEYLSGILYNSVLIEEL